MPIADIIIPIVPRVFIPGIFKPTNEKATTIVPNIPNAIDRPANIFDARMLSSDKNAYDPIVNTIAIIENAKLTAPKNLFCFIFFAKLSCNT